jgi:glycosyltransferase involved in cell wall biosynthesis
MKIAFLTRTMSGGGAERQFALLAQGLAARGHDIVCFVFYRQAGIDLPPGVRVVWLAKRGRWDVLGFFRRLVAALRAERPHLLYAYLPVANGIALLARRFVPRLQVVIGVRSSALELSRYDYLQRASHRLERRLARGADLVIVNSAAGRADLAAAGYPVEKIRVIRNGIDAAAFRPDAAARSIERAAWRWGAEDFVVGMVARLDPMKDHGGFLAALARLAPKHEALHAVVVAEGSRAERRRLERRAGELGIADRISWSGRRDDMAALYNALDLLCLPSAFGEGSPNVVGEAMACGVPCIVTDVGDCAILVGDTGSVVPPRDPAALAASLERLLAAPAAERLALGAAARERIIATFSVARLVDETEIALGALRQGR